MAEKRVIEIEVNTKGAVKSMDALEKATNDVSKSFSDVYGDLQPLTARMGEAEDRLYELANAGKTTSQEYKDLLKSVGDFRKVQISTDMAVDAAATTMGQKLGGALGGVTSGFSLAQGAFAAFGAESKEVEQALLKVQAAMAIQQGIQGIREAIPAIKALATEIRALVSATGIGLIVVSLGLVYAYWEDISKAVGFAGDETEKYAKQQKAIGEEAKKQSEEIAKESGAFATLILRLKATNQNTKEREELIKKINLQYGTTLKNIKDERDFQEQLNTELASYLEYQKAKYSLQKNEDLIVKNLEKQDRIKREILNTEKELKKEALKILEIEEGAGVKFDEKTDTYIPKIKEQLKDLRSELKEAEKRFENYGESAQKAAIQVDILTKAGTKYVEQVKKDKPETTKAELDGIKTLNENIASLQEEARVSKLTDEQKEVDAINKKYTKLIEEGKKFKIDVTTLEEEKRLALAAITKKYDDLEQVAKDEKTAKEKERVANEKAVLEELTKSEAELKLIKLNEEYKAQQLLYKDNKEILKALDEKYAKDKEVLDNEETEKKKDTLQKQLDLVKDSFQAFADVATLFAGKNKKAQKTAFNIQKGANIAQTTIDTFTAAMAAYKSAVGIPYVGPFLAPIAAAGATAVGLLNIRKIAASKFEGGGTPSGGDGGGGATAPTMSAPQFNVVGQSGVNQLASLNQQPIQAYVVSGQVTSQQALDRNRLANATLGG